MASSALTPWKLGRFSPPEGAYLPHFSMHQAENQLGATKWAPLARSWLILVNRSTEENMPSSKMQKQESTAIRQDGRRRHLEDHVNALKCGQK